MTVATRLAALALAALAAVAAHLSLGLKGDVAFALELRAVRLAALVQVAAAVALATVAFQTVTANRILTPSILGMDALFVLVQTVLVAALGGVGFATVSQRTLFFAQTGAMVGLCLALFLPLLRRRGDLMLMLLAGVVLGILLRSLAALAARLVDPNDFALLQGASYASFTALDVRLVAPAAALTLAAAAALARLRHVLDVMTLGAQTATGLGVDWPRAAALVLVLVGVLVAVSTALVGPVGLFGLIVAAVAPRVVGTARHGPLLLAAVLVAVVLLVGGQTLLGTLLGNAVALPIVLDLVGGLVFLALLFAQAGR